MIWLEGQTLADKIKGEVRDKVSHFRETRGEVPGLVGILVGENPASQVYLRTKEKSCRALGISSEILSFPPEFTPSQLRAEIERLNHRDEVDGVLVQLPLPPEHDPFEAISAILPDKDVDGFHPYNLGKLLMGQKGLQPCTPLGIMELLDFFGIRIEGKAVVIIGRSLIVGKPLAAMMTNKNGTVTICHSKTSGLAEIASRADILVAAMGRPAFVLPDFVKPGAVVVDVGINHLSDPEKVKELFGRNEKREKSLAEKGYTIVGDVHPDAAERASFMTPVPGGVGLLTVAMLMRNTLEAFQRRRRLSE